MTTTRIAVADKTTVDRSASVKMCSQHLEKGTVILTEVAAINHPFTISGFFVYYNTVA